MNRRVFLPFLITVLLWSLLPVLSSQIEHVPPFLLVGVTLCIAGCVGLLRWRDWRVPPITFAVGVGGIFGNLFFYYYSLQNAPVIEANLLNYLYPVFMVFLAPLFFPGCRIQSHHLAGALLGFAGAGLIVSGGRLELPGAALVGYLAGIVASLLWACYSLATKRLPAFPSGAVGGFCLASGVLALGVFALQARAVGVVPVLLPEDWVIFTAIGIGPSGLAYFAWDLSMKRGDPRVVGALTYLTPLLSTLILAALGRETLALSSLLAMVLIILGAMISSLESLPWLKKSRLNYGAFENEQSG